MSEWKTVILSDLGTIVGGATPSTKREDYYHGDIAWITPKDLSGYSNRFISRGERNITQAGLNSCSAKILPKHSVLFTSRAPIGYVAIANNDICTNQGFKSIVPNNETNFMFLYYLLTYYKEKIEGVSSGTTFKEVSGAVMKNIEVSVPNYDTQKQIASILSSIDDKIELNNKINDNLEQQAQAIFKSWFVDFKPFGGVMPSEWKIATLGAISNITSGKRPPMKQIAPTKDVNIPLVGAASIMGYTNDILYNEKILVTGRVGTHGVIQRFNSPCWASDNSLVVKSDFHEFVYQILKTIDYKNMNRGSTQPLITQTDLKNVEIVLPSNLILNEFEILVISLMNKHESNKIENQKLAQLRDALLPKLMSGEIDVSNLEA